MIGRLMLEEVRGAFRVTEMLPRIDEFQNAPLPTISTSSITSTDDSESTKLSRLPPWILLTVELVTLKVLMFFAHTTLREEFLAKMVTLQTLSFPGEVVVR